MANIGNKTLTIALAILGVSFTLTGTAPQRTTTNYHTPPLPPATSVVLWPQPEEPANDELRVPEALVNALPTEERSNHTIDLRMPEALLAHLYGAGRVSGLEKSPAP